MDASVWLLLGLVVLALGLAAARDLDLPRQALGQSLRLVRSVGAELVLGFLLAGLVQVLLPVALLREWLGSERLGRGILVGWAVGLLLPGGPYFFFPFAGSLAHAGAAAGPVIALLSAKTLVSPIRMLTYEAPLMGWPLTLARCIPGLLLPPVLGLLGQWLYVAFKR
jgi:uncharacterized membrane protein YraQ (UPF0718 family)